MKLKVKQGSLTKKDKRFKGCPDERCKMHIKKKLFANDMKTCPQCGAELIYVCKKCYKQIEDKNWGRTLCLACEAEKTEKRRQMKDKMMDAGKLVAVTAFSAIATGVQKNAIPILKDAGGKVVVNVVKLRHLK